MRELILNRIEEIKKHENGFNKNTMKWAKMKIDDVHISEVDLTTLDDETLFIVFESIVKWYYRQM